MKPMKRKKRQTYSTEFKEQAISLANDIGIKEAAEKLGINPQSLSGWTRYAKKIDEDSEFQELEKLRQDVKKLKKELEYEKRSVAILKDAARFFCLDQEK